MTQIAPTSLTPSIIFLVLFSISTLWHIVLYYKHPQRFFIPFLIGGLCQVFGYISRAIYAEDDTLMPYINETLFLLFAPIFYAASVYGLLGKLVVYVKAESTIPLKPTLITWIFVTSDVVSFIIQSIGGGLQAISSSTMNLSLMETGGNIVVGGLGVQLCIFFFFIILTILFDSRTRHKKIQGNWRRLLRVIELSCVLMLIRSIYRIIEYAQGFEGYLISHEVYFLVFDSVMMLCTQLLYNTVYPAKTLSKMKSPSKVEISVDEKFLGDPLHP